MKTLFALLALFASLNIRADLFIGPTTPSNRLTVGTGQVALISSIYPQKQFDEFLSVTNSTPITGNIISNGVSTSVYIAECKNGTTAIVGPVELEVTSPAVIRYQVLSNTPINCAIVRPGSSTTLTVPAGKTIRFLSFDLGGFATLIANGTMSRNGVNFSGVEIFGGAELDGPLTISFTFPAELGSNSYTLPYYFLDSAIAVPDKLAIQSATGSSEIQLQKSFDLTNWTSSVAVPVTSAAKTFYRIKTSR